MSLPNEQGTGRAGDDSASCGAPGVPASAAQAAESVSNGVSTFDDVIHGRLAERLDMVEKSADPMAELDTAIETFADELSRANRSSEKHLAVFEHRDEMEGAIETLVNVALDMDDPVRGLEEGAESLAETLAARDIAARSHLLAAHERERDERAAYRHARFHRVAELIDAGYSLDQAIAVTNANETEVRARAMATGRDPMEPIYQYAVLNGYRSSRPAPSTSIAGSQPSLAAAKQAEINAHAVEALARLSDEAFAEATKGDRWQKLMQR